MDSLVCACQCPLRQAPKLNVDQVAKWSSTYLRGDLEWEVRASVRLGPRTVDSMTEGFRKLVVGLNEVVALNEVVVLRSL